ncbi:DUF6571 family protein [Sphaerisporangium rubeum]|uniref:DUF6571 domain-containing protein n=1 Tax=Sphaerisporangium rubeum TaxID=321317 RepID=A0A7X0M8R9_9ACTN|nr:DUF6571 family protein [Sphaerisporangium rubeum]MBB6475682.1 hypothetical protein [Sphaerisporangium rubeum]
MDAFINSLEHARNQISEHTEAIRRVLTANAVPTTSLNPISEIEHWIDTKLPDLRRRHQIARATSNLPDWSPAGTPHLIPYAEAQASTTPAESRLLGTELAGQYKRINPDALMDPLLDQKYQQIIDTLADHVNDPEFTAAFFAALGLEATLLLPVLARKKIGMPNGVGTVQPPDPSDKVLTTISNAFATAITAGTHIPGMAAIKEALRTTPATRLNRFGTSLLVLTGRFPADWLAQVVAINTSNLTTNPIAGFLYALGNNPTAARLTLRLSAGDYTKNSTNLATLLTRLATRSRGDGLTPEADSFGRMLAAAAGAYDEKDGHHSKDAATVAFTIMTTLPQTNVGQATRIHLAEIAASYATEILEGANLADRNHILPSSNTPVKSSIPGLHPAFHLNPEDTYHYLKTFTDTLPNQAPFQAAMGQLTTRLIKEAVPQMLKSKDPNRLDDTFAALGNVRGLELAARETWGNAQDQAAEESRQLQSLLIGNAAGGVGLAFSGVGAVVYTGLSAAWSYYDTTKAAPQSEVDKIRASDARETLGRQHTIAQALLDAGFPPGTAPEDYQSKSRPVTPIADSDGRLQPFPEIIKSGKQGLDDFDGWLIANGLGGNDDGSLGAIAQKTGDIYDGRKANAYARARLFDDSLS